MELGPMERGGGQEKGSGERAALLLTPVCFLSPLPLPWLTKAREPWSLTTGADDLQPIGD